VKSAVHYLAVDAEHCWQNHGATLIEAAPLAGQPLIALIDCAEETLVPASLPLVDGIDGGRLRRRRLEREFPGARLRTVITARRRSRSSQHEVVFASVAAEDSMQARLDALGAAHPLRAVCTPALLAADWVRSIGAATGQQLIVLPTPAGLRLIFLDQGLPLLTRLTAPIAHGDTAIEIARTIQYLQNAQRIDRKQPVELWFWGVASGEQERALPADVPYRLAGPRDLRRAPDPVQHGLPALIEHATLAYRGAQLGTESMRVLWRARQATRLALRSAAVVLGAGILSAGTFAWRAQQVQRELAAIRAQAADIGSRQSELESALQVLGVDVETVRLLPEAEHALRAGEVLPEDLYAQVGHVHGQESELRVQALEFYSAPIAGAQPAVDRNCAGEPLPTVAFARVAFTLQEGLDVRRSSEALERLRADFGQLASWRVTDATRSVGTHDTLKIGTAGDAPADGLTTCLMREIRS
jgi:hypothetical protein